MSALHNSVCDFETDTFQLLAPFFFFNANMTSTADILLAPFPGKTISVPYLGYEPVNLLIERAKHLLSPKYLIERETIYFNGIGIRDGKATIDECRCMVTLSPWTSVVALYRQKDAKDLERIQSTSLSKH